MPSDLKRYIALGLADRDGWGWNEQTAPPLVALLEEAEADQIYVSLKMVTGFFATSPAALERVHAAVGYAELLRTHDVRFVSLGIGIVEGELIAAFTAEGRLDPAVLPLGDTMRQVTCEATQLGRHHEAIIRLRAELSRAAR